MRLNKDFIIQEIGDEYIMVPVGEAGRDFRGFIRLNKTSSYIVNNMKDDITRDELIKLLSDKYEGTEEDFNKAVDETISILKEVNAIIDL